MQVRFKNCDRSEATISHIEKRLSKLSRFKLADVEGLHVEIEFLKKEKKYVVKMNLPIHKHLLVSSESKATSVLTAINNATEKTLDQLRRIKVRDSK